MNNWEKFKLLVKVSRPIYWIIAPIIFLAAVIYGNGEINILVILQAILFSFPACLFTFGITDIYDYNSDRLNSRKDNKFEGKLNKEHHNFVKKYSLISGLVVMVGSSLSFNILIIFLNLVLLLGLYYYSAPPLRMKEIPVLDAIIEGLVFFIVVILGFMYSGSEFGEIPTKSLFIIFIFMGAHFLWSSVDYEADKKAKHKTSATLFGKKISISLSFVLFLILLLFSGIKNIWINVGFVLTIVMSALVFLNQSKKTISKLSKIYVFLVNLLLIIFIITVLFGNY